MKIFIALLAFATCALGADRNTVINEAIAHVKQLQKELSVAKANQKQTANELNQTTKELGTTVLELTTLQQQIDEHTKLLNDSRVQTQKALVEAEKWNQKHTEAVKKLWWWRLHAFGLGLLGIVIFVIGLLTKGFKVWSRTV